MPQQSSDEINSDKTNFLKAWFYQHPELILTSAMISLLIGTIIGSIKPYPIIKSNVDPIDRTRLEERLSLLEEALEEIVLQNETGETEVALASSSVPETNISDEMASPANNSSLNTGNAANSQDFNKETSFPLALEKYDIWSLSHRKATLQAQFIKDNILFFVVLTVVSFGLYLSYVQFKKGNQSEGNLKLGPAGIEVTSSVLGILILAFSIGFLYLYLVHVFPIVEIGTETLPTEASKSN